MPISFSPRSLTSWHVKCYILSSQVGVGSLIVGYTICGAFVFQIIETADLSHDHVKDVNQAVQIAVSKLWVITNEYNLLNKRLDIRYIDGRIQMLSKS